MNKALSAGSARLLASSLWTNHRHGRGMSPAVDRDFARQADELMMLTLTTTAGRPY